MTKTNKSAPHNKACKPDAPKQRKVRATRTNADKRKALEVAVSRGSGVALWRQIAEDLETDIMAGKLEPGTRLPTETELAEQYTVNRHTLRRALAELSRKGLVEATPRRGTFVSKPRIPYQISDRTRFSENISQAGRDPGGRLLSTRLGTAPVEMAEWLGIAQVAAAVELHYVRAANDIPICLATTWLPADRFARIGAIYEHVGSLTKAFARLGIKTYHRKRTRIAGRLATTDERELLEVPRGTVIMLVDSLDVDSHGEPISVSHARFVADRVELIMEH